MAGRYKAKRKPYYFNKLKNRQDDQADTDSLVNGLSTLKLSPSKSLPQPKKSPKDSPKLETKTKAKANDDALKKHNSTADVDSLLDDFAGFKLEDGAVKPRVKLRDYQQHILRGWFWFY